MGCGGEHCAERKQNDDFQRPLNRQKQAELGWYEESELAGLGFGHGGTAVAAASSALHQTAGH